MKQEEKELLEKYLAYRKKRNRILIIIIVIVIALTGIICSWIYISFSNSNDTEEDTTQIQEETKIEDTEKPVISLKAKQISIYQNDTINYTGYIESAIDNIDGNITENVKYNTIDTNKIGEFVITYSVQDEAKNEATEQIKVIINKREEKTEKETSTSDTSNKTNNKPASNDKTSEQNSGGTSSTQKNNTNNTQKTKDFLFTDGYDMNTVSKAASDYIDANGGRGEAYPIRDQEGIIIGMRVKIY